MYRPNQTTSDTSEETDNPVYKLMTGKLQPVLHNVLIWSAEVSQDNVATRLRCD